MSFLTSFSSIADGMEKTPAEPSKVGLTWITAISKVSITVVFKCSPGLCEVVSQRRSMRQMWARNRETGTGRERTVDWQ